MRVLVADDERNITQILVSVIHDLGHEADVAHDGARAIEMLQQNHYDIAFIDHNMPETTGLEILNFARKRSLPTKIIIVSGYLNLEESFFRKFGADAYLGKPFRLEEIEKHLNDYAPKRPTGD